MRTKSILGAYLLFAFLIVGFTFLINSYYPSSVPSIYNIANSYMPLFKRYGLMFSTIIVDIQEIINTIISFTRIKNLSDIFNLLKSIFNLIQPIITLLLTPIRFIFDFVATTFSIIVSGSGIREICQYWNGFNC